MSLWVPPTVDARLRDEAARDQAEILGAVSHLKGTLEHWNRELKRIDERLEMAWFDEGVSIAGVKPCRYHVLRRNDPPSPWAIIPIEDEQGNFVEPDSGVFEMLLRNDMWSEAAQAERRKARSRAEAEKARQRERDAEERQQEIVERIHAARRAFISMDRSAPWTQNVQGRRGAKGS
jgi:hypothetical protein